MKYDASDRPGPTSAGSQFGTGRRVVVADDDPIQLQIIGLHLVSRGFEVVRAVDGAEALERIREAPPDLVVSDVRMPRLDGFALCEAVRADPSLADLPIVLVTSAFIEGADRDRARRSGASVLLSRTEEFGRVLVAVSEILPPIPRGHAPHRR